MPFLIKRDKMRAEGKNHYPYILGMELNYYKLKPKVYFCFRLIRTKGDLFQNRALLEYLPFYQINKKNI